MKAFGDKKKKKKKRRFFSLFLISPPHDKFNETTI